MSLKILPIGTLTVVTGADGTAKVSVTILPDNLTSWRVLARGLTKDTLVGEAVSEVVTTQPLIVQPVAPRFVVWAIIWNWPLWCRTRQPKTLK